MKADKPSRLVPKLRFPEFAKAPGWDHSTVASLVDVIAPPKKLPTSAYLERGRFAIVDQSQNYICGWTNDDEAVIVKPLPAIVFGDHTCVLKFIDQPFAQGADGIKIFKARKHVSTVYLYYQLSHRPVVQERYKRHFSTLKNKEVCFPDAKSGEQQKIADCLGSLDELIAAEGRKLEALRRHKQGLMQQLFPRPGETVPRLRFPEFRDASEWEPRMLGRIGEFIGGGTPSTAIPEYWGGDIQWFTPSEVNKRYLSKSIRTITGDGLQHSSARLLPAGALLITTRATIGDVGIADNACTTNQGFQSLVVSGHEVNLFWYYWFVKHKFELIKRSSGSTFLEIGKAELKQIPTVRPNKGEQQKIANCLGSLDNLIAAQGRKVEALRQHKQGLLQQLFPPQQGR